jgi:serine/threonine protein kinase
MGACASVVVGGGGGTLLEKNDGDQAAYAARFTEDRVLGEGEFGEVKLVYEKSTEESSRNMYACKTLRKGVVFKDNTLYPPLPAEILRGEVEMLQTLNGEHYCMKLVAIFETPKALLMVADCYSGGEMMEYVAKQKEDLRTEDVSRIAFQLLSSIDHCAKNSIIHRDIKPENAMFVTEAPGAELRLIDFGSGTNRVAVEGMHTTFAGTPFYNSPEMFQKNYTSKTDVWSVGVILYVLVAGYPSEALQKAFNILLDGKRKSLKSLPNMPDNMPDSYYELLEGLLTYRHKVRKSAGDMLKSDDFVKFHNDLAEEEQDEMASIKAPTPARASRMQRTSSVALLGSVGRHSTFLDFKKYERSLTTVLATMLDREELGKLLSILNERYESDENQTTPQLQVVLVSELKNILMLEIGNEAW